VFEGTDATKAIYIAASSSPPYNAYGTPFGGTAYCGNVISVDSDGVLSEVIQNYTYSSTSGVHGLAFSPDNSYLYSADDGANSVWTHKIDETTGTLEVVEQLVGPETGADPRHLAVHPNGTYAYVVFEGANELAVYSIDQTTGKLVFTNTVYPLIADGTMHVLS
jgi:carboxy-cis,cis-muconate cyclase